MMNEITKTVIIPILDFGIHHSVFDIRYGIPDFSDKVSACHGT